MAVRLFREIYDKSSNLSVDVPFQSPKNNFLERCVISALRFAVQPHNVSVVLDLTQEDFDRHVSPDEIVETDVNISWRVLSLASQLGSTEITVQLLQRFPPRNRTEMQEIFRRLHGALTNCLGYVAQLNSAGARVRFFGDLEKLPVEIQMLMADVEAKTICNSKTILNVTLGGAATHTAAATISALSEALINDRLRSEDLTLDFLNFTLARSSPPASDVRIRSSDIVATYRWLSQSFPMRLLMNSTVYKLFIQDSLPDLAFWTYIKALLLHQQQGMRDFKADSTSGPGGTLRNVLSELRQREFLSFRSLGRQQGSNPRHPNRLPLEDKTREEHPSASARARVSSYKKP